MTQDTKDEPLGGRCLCGHVRIVLIRPQPTIDVCHCSMCRRWGGTFYGGVKGDDFTVEGRDNVGEYRSSQWAERAFCRTCGSHLWFRFIPADHHSFLAGLFDLPAGFAIEQQIFHDEKPDWYDLVQDTPVKTGAEVIAEAKAAGYSFD